MNPESFKQYVGYYMDSYNELTGILMSVNAEYYNTDE